MAKPGGVFLLDENDRRKLNELWEWRRGLSGKGVSNTPFGGVVNVNAAGDEAPPSVPGKVVLVRIAGTAIASTSLGAGKYDAYIQNVGTMGGGTNATSLGGTNNVALSEIGITDAARVIFWNTFESTTIASTDVTHIMYNVSGNWVDDLYPLGLLTGKNETVGSGSNATTLQIVVGFGIPGWGCP